MRKLTLALITLTVAPAAAQDTTAEKTPTLASVVAAAESIAIVTVAARHEISVEEETAIDLIECEVERQVFGVARKKLFLVARGPAGAEPLEVGGRFLLFTARDGRPRMTKPTRQRIAETTGGATLQRYLTAPWPVGASGGEFEVRAGVELPKGFPVTAGRTPIEPALGRIGEVVGEQAWSLRAAYATSGPGFWSVIVESDGNWGCGADGDQLSEEERAALRESIGECTAPEIPGSVGRSRGPGSPFLMLTMRTDRVVRTIRVHPPQDADSEEVNAQRLRLLELWRSLPGEGRPALPGTR